ncbi:uncharacterized protein ACA1_276340 [Acanthamoeba castellanii str. Neff]|uniref:Fanconi-associated nuclease n=1 Tax=Acanthamoeba castellanii (strain ATCC 30010 / Neff) TaxID=1257118 RepID=L8GQG1_ACACF|nr:uncharacterized protein ACA1_276340 [Acanthamoeba castellanii str. Neff]ELR15419.1 hypothetical protein ACA1_276340 [Acanthamoeba castellanii str. Neff]
MPSYYLYNFVLILESVRKLHGHLLTPKEEHLLRTFEGMGEGAKRLYIRLFQRKGPWFRTATLSYPEIDVLDATLELQRLGFCETLEGVHDRDITPDLLNTLSKYQLQAVLRAAQGTFLASLGAGMRVADIINAITGTAYTQQTLDGRSVLSKVVERELRSAAPRAEAALPTVAPSGDRPRFCAIRLSRPSRDLFKRMQRLFFLNDTQDMTLLLLVGMDKVKYPAYACPHIDIHAWKSPT